MEHPIEEWIAAAPQDRVTFRQAVHIVLQAIASSEYLQPRMIMKGGILLGLRYQSSRFTEDIDFSTNMRFADIDQDTLREELNDALVVTSAELPYQITCAVQRITIHPRNPEEATFPAFQLKIAYARNNNSGEISRLRAGQSPQTVKIDYSLNEQSLSIDHITLTDDENVQIYSFTDLVAEKIRSVVQQIVRDRSRRQDIYDLNLLLDSMETGDEEKFAILNALIKKSAGRLQPGMLNPDTLNIPEIRERSLREYHLLKDEIADPLPDFNVAYTRIQDFYRALPWEAVAGWQDVAE